MAYILQANGAVPGTQPLTLIKALTAAGWITEYGKIERVTVRRFTQADSSVRTLNEAVEALKRRMIEDALRECGSKTQAAEQLGLTRQSLQQMLRRRQ